MSVITNFYNAVVTGAARLLHSYGSQSTPVSIDASPTVMFEKVSSLNQGGGNVWDQGALYVSLEKKAGDAYAAAFTAYGVHSGGSNDVIAAHARADIKTNGVGGRGWAYWGVTNNYNLTITPWHVAELNGCNQGADPGYGGVGQMLRLCMSDLAASTNRMSTAISIGKSTHGGNNGFYTGINFEADAIIGAPNWNSNGEAICLKGPSTQINGHSGGIRFRSGWFGYGLRFDEANFVNDTVMVVRANQNISYGWSGSDVFLKWGPDRIQVGGGAILDLKRGQVMFPATQVPSTSPYVLDDYREVTFIPSLNSECTYIKQDGECVKIGKLVTFNIRLVWYGYTSNTPVAVTNLPFTANGTYSVSVSDSDTSAVVSGNVLTFSKSQESADLVISGHYFV